MIACSLWVLLCVLLAPGTPAMSWRVHTQEKSSQDPGPNTLTATKERKEVLIRPNPPNPQKRVPT